MMKSNAEFLDAASKENVPFYVELFTEKNIRNAFALKNLTR